MLPEQEARASILIVDDELLIRNLLLELLKDHYNCVGVESAEEALTLLRTETFNVVISDIKMPGISGLEMIPQVLGIDPNTVVVMISGLKNIDSAITAMQAGAFDYLVKPFSFDQVEAVVERAVDHQSLLLTKKFYENHLEELVALRTDELREQITERQDAEEKVNRMAFYDSLTELPNPTLFRDRLTRELDLATVSRQKTAVVFLALDRFKKINDTLGHEIGDELLRQAARRLTNSIRQVDSAAYFGGAEFALLFANVSGAEDTAKLAENVLNALRPPFYCAGHELFLTASMGISLAPNDGKNCQNLRQNAGTALDRARQKGGDMCQFFTNDMHEIAVKRLSLENSLRHALERDEFILNYQPKINAKTGELSGMEALVRWKHPLLGIVPPNDFIPVAEESGLIMPLGEWVLRTACRQNMEWQRAGLTALRISVNLSLRQFQQPNLIEIINQTLDETGLAPEYLELELTESSLIDDIDQAIETLNKLKLLGIKISLDDFGSGYSSLAYLKTLPIDILKIDRAFVRNIETDSRDVAIVKTIVTLARNLNLKTIVEGVETKEQSDIVCDLDCDEIQGYFFSKPISAEAFELLLRESQTDILVSPVAAVIPEFV